MWLCRLSANTSPSKAVFVNYKLAVTYMDAGQYDDALSHFHRTLGCVFGCVCAVLCSRLTRRLPPTLFCNDYSANPDFAAAQEGLERLEKLTRGEDPDADDAAHEEDAAGGTVVRPRLVCRHAGAPFTTFTAVAVCFSV